MTGKGYGFTKKPELAPVAPPQERRSLDLSGLENIRPVEVSAEKEKAAIAAGEAMGFRAREASPQEVESTSAPRRRIPKVPQDKLLVAGPLDILDRFKQYSVSRGHRAYWQTLKELMDGKH